MFHLWNLVLDHPFLAGIIFLILVISYKIYNFVEIVVDYKEEVPKHVRILSDQTLPPNFPNGWIPILESRAIQNNEVKSVTCFGQELAVIRGAIGKVYVIDAFCPHLGANLAIGGEVNRTQNCKEDCIRCPFHGWSFRMSDGKCSDIPYEESPDKYAKVRLWECKEVNGAIFVWYHAESQTPNWHLQPVGPIESNDWIYRGRTEHLVNCHMQEIPENGADVAHLGEIHVQPFMYGSDLNRINKLKRLFNVLEHDWKAEWNVCNSPNDHMTEINIINTNKLFGIALLSVTLKVNQIGPGYVELRFQSSFLGGVKGVMLQFVTPIGPMRNSIVHQVYTENTLSGYFFSKFLLIAESKMLERDIQIWNRKAFMKKIYPSKSEKSLVKYRRWFAQFYSENSKRMIDW